MEENIRRCAIFGQNAICFKWGFDEDEKQCCRMKRELLQKIMELRQQNVTQFFVACDYGVGVALQTSCEKFSYNLQKRNGA